MSAILTAKGLAAGHADRLLFSGLDLVIAPGEITGLVGANGAGKSTLLRILAGLVQPDQGKVGRTPRRPAGPGRGAMISLSGGQGARVNLASLLLSRYDVFLLDEPTNDLDIAGLEILEGFVRGLRAGTVLVSHDRAFLERTVHRVPELTLAPP